MIFFLDDAEIGLDEAEIGKPFRRDEEIVSWLSFIFLMEPGVPSCLDIGLFLNTLMEPGVPNFLRVDFLLDTLMEPGVPRCLEIGLFLNSLRLELNSRRLVFFALRHFDGEMRAFFALAL